MSTRSNCIRGGLFVLAFVLLSGWGAAADRAGQKLVIEYGWDKPTPAYIKANYGAMDELPFDGVAIKVVSGTDPRAYHDLGRFVFAGARFTPEEYEQSIEDLRAAHPRHMTHNFIKINSIPDSRTGYPGPDWFDDNWSTVAYNAGCMARIAKQGGNCDGLLFDPEFYGVLNPWCYNTLPDSWKAGRTFDEVAAAVRERGKGFMEAINAEYPNITILCTTIAGAPYSHGPDNVYGLLAEFFAGMCDAADDGTTIVNGNECGYGNRTRDKFVTERGFTQNVILHADNVQEFQDHIRGGMTVWVDCRFSGYRVWDPVNFANNYYTPEQFRQVLSWALELSDKYVWIYSEQVGWWYFNGAFPQWAHCTEAVPPAYIRALATAPRVAPAVEREQMFHRATSRR